MTAIPRAMLALSLFSCDFRPALPPLADGPRVVPATITERVQVEAVLPTDLDPLPEGGFAVLDGYAGRLLRFDVDGTPRAPLQSDGLRGAVRVSPTGDGWWAADPERGELRRLDAEGQVTRTVLLEGATDVVARGDTMWVSTRQGTLVRTSREGEVVRTVDVDVDGAPLASLAGLLPAPDGTLHAIDVLGHEIHVFDPEGEPVGRWGRFGMWIGTLSKPKAAAWGPAGTLVVGDTGLSAVQLFEPDGTSLGVIARDGAPWGVEHPIQVLSLGKELLVLDAAAATVWAAVVSEDAVREAREQAGLRHLRTALVDTADVSPHAGEARQCRQCHDGFVNDDRYVWDPTLAHHPVGEVPERTIPAFFPVDDNGALRCGTCHTPHGLASLPAAEGVAEGSERAELIRHQAPSSDLFTRLSRDDAALCVGCHTDAAHDKVLERLGLEGTSHPTGGALARALAERGSTAEAGLPPGIDGSCLTCHTPHGAVREPLGRATQEGPICLSCHDVATERRHHPLGVPAPDLRASAELPLGVDGIACITCHDLVRGHGDPLLRHAADGGPACSACHQGPSESSPHRREGCAECHAPHEAAGDALMRTVTATDPAGCTACHDEFGQHGHPTATDELTCGSCHDAHDPSPPRKECAECHEPITSVATRGPHAEVGCDTCHPPHEAGPRAVADQPADAPCLACHGPRASGDAPRIQAWSHDAPVFGGAGPRWDPLRGLTLYTTEGKAAKADEGGELSCQSCHAVHGPAEGRDDLQLPGWETPCGACHGDETTWRYESFHHPTQRRSGP